MEATRSGIANYRSGALTVAVCNERDIEIARDDANSVMRGRHTILYACASIIHILGTHLLGVPHVGRLQPSPVRIPARSLSTVAMGAGAWGNSKIQRLARRLLLGETR